jgi:hypothetical protein
VKFVRKATEAGNIQFHYVFIVFFYNIGMTQIYALFHDTSGEVRNWCLS